MIVNSNNPVKVNMIHSFEDTEAFCAESYPCQHGPFEIVLKDGRKIKTSLDSVDVYSILQGLHDIGVVHKEYEHFSCYKNAPSMGWKIQPADVILTRVFAKAML